MTADDIISAIIAREGSIYTNNPVDKGGPTKFGVTLATLAQYKPGSTIEDVQNMTEATARAVYATVFVAPFSGYNEPDLGLLVDSAVQHGVGRVKGWLQQYHGPAAGLYPSILARRIVFYGQIVEASPSQSQFIKGWLARASVFIR